MIAIVFKEGVNVLRRMKRNTINLISVYLLYVFLAMITIGPFIFLLSTSLKGPTENLMRFPPHIIPQQPTLQNYIKVFDTVPIFTYFLNSTIVAAFVIFLQLVISSMAAYPLARMEFKGKAAIFLLIISTMFIPAEVTMIPIYVIITKYLQLKNSLLGLILQGAVGAFGVFLMRQAFLSVPKELDEAAIIDGCGSFRIFTKILLPVVRPSLGALAIFIFIGSWNSFLFPLLLLEKAELYTLPIGLLNLQGTFSTDVRLVSAGSAIALVPILVVFISMQKYFMGGMTAGAVKG